MLTCWFWIQTIEIKSILCVSSYLVSAISWEEAGYLIKR